MAEIDLVPLTEQELSGLADLQPADYFATAPEGALPPPHVAARALRQLAAGTPPFWCVPFQMVVRPAGALMGGCTFKGVPENGEVEIAYGVARSMRGRGIASAAVAQLLQLAARSGAVQRVVAEIVVDNTPSIRLVSRLGFVAGAPFVDTDGETVQRWTYRLPAARID
ncbi:MAG: family N-acetyltransferase [Pseudoduganella sp.]|jgi:RimJ/RimL family protein N-acetyltransferase|nr:family N-acetyltransferase [Pseudoduganella sp.]